MCELPVDYVSALAAQRARQVAVSGQLGPFRGVRLSEKREKKGKLSREGNHITPEDETCSRASPSFFPFIFRPSFRLASSYHN